MNIHDGKAKRYNRMKVRVFYFMLGADLVLLWGWMASGLSVRLAEHIAGVTANVWIINGLYLLCFSVVMAAVHGPFDFFQGFVWEHRYGLSRLTLAQWVKEETKKSLLSFALVLLAAQGVYALLRKFPSGWWLPAAAFWLFLTVVLARIMPRVIIPLFYKYVKIGDASLRQRILALFGRCRVSLDDIYVIDMSRKTKKANAFLCGLGRRRRVVLSDTLLQDFSPDEIETVVAHELGHDRHHDIVRLIAFNTALTLAAFYLVSRVLRWTLAGWGIVSPGDIAGFPVFVLAMTGFSLVTAPLSNAFSRRLETAADRYSLMVTEKKDALMSMLEKLGTLNLADFAPGRFQEIMFYDHPPLAKRIARVRAEACGKERVR